MSSMPSLIKYNIAVLKEAKRKELKEARDSYIASDIDGFQVGRIEDRENIQGAIASFDAISIDGLTRWIMADNTSRFVSLEELSGVANGYVARKAQAFGHYGNLLVELDNASTKDQVDSIVWELG